MPYRSLYESLDKQIEEFLNSFPEQDKNLAEKYASDSVKLLTKKYRVLHTKLRPHQKEWYEAAKLLHNCKVNEEHRKAGYENFKVWVSETYGISWRQAFGLIRAYEEFKDTNFWLLPYKRVNRLLTLPKEIRSKLVNEGMVHMNKEGKTTSYTIKDLAFIKANEFRKVFFYLKELPLQGEVR